jgi:hypothetical protein
MDYLLNDYFVFCDECMIITRGKPKPYCITCSEPAFNLDRVKN